MREFSFYSSVAEPTLYRYQIRETGQVYHVTISVVHDEADEQVVGSKVLRNITRNDVIRECLSHCRRHSTRDPLRQGTVLLTGIRTWLVSSIAVLAFIRLMIIKN
jgi:hypothetical protein